MRMEIEYERGQQRIQSFERLQTTVDDNVDKVHIFGNVGRVRRGAMQTELASITQRKQLVDKGVRGLRGIDKGNLQQSSKE